MNTGDRTLIDWTRLLVSNYTKYPESLEVIGDNCHIAIRGHRADQGKLIGKSGKNVMALQKILSGIAGKTVSVDVLTPSTGTLEEPEDFVPDKWTRAKEESLLHLLARVFGAIYERGQVFPVSAAADESRFLIQAPELTTEMEHAIYTLFRAIGNSRGRKISVGGRSGSQNP